MGRGIAGVIQLIVGLGNPGARYVDTPHNLGFRVVEELARRHGWALDRQECNARTAGDGELLLAAPQTYMNRSGHAVRCLVERHGLAPVSVLVVYDDVALPLGRLRLRAGGSPGGHRGMESVVAGLQTDEVPRLRLGVGDEGGEGRDLTEYVLSPFRPELGPEVAALVVRAADAAQAWRAEGPAAAMNRFNG